MPLTRLFSGALLLFSLQTPAAPAPQATGTAVVTGQVLDAVTGRPIGGATVMLAIGTPPGSALPGNSAPPPAPQARRAVAISNAEGRFVFRDVPAGSFSLTSTLEGYASGATGRRRPNGPGRSFAVSEGARVTDARVTMWKLSTISGHVRDDRGEPAIGVFVTAMRRVLNGGRYELSFAGSTGEATDERGYYRLNNIMPGSYVLVIRTITQTMSVPSADQWRAAVTAGSTASLTAQHRATGAVQISGRGLEIDGWIVGTLSGDSAVMPGPNGTLLVPPHTFYPAARTAAEATVITLTSGDDRTGVDLTLPLAAGVRVSGVLMGPEGPAANHGIRLSPVNDGEPVYDFPVAYGVTDASGRFAVLGVTPGNYIIRSYRVTPSGPAFMRPEPAGAGAPPGAVGAQPAPPAPAPSLFAELPVTVGRSHVDNLSLSLQPGGRISGRVVINASSAAAGKPPNITMNIRSLAGAMPGATNAVVDPSNGAFSFMGFAPGRYVLTHAVAPPGPELTVASIVANGVEIADKVFTLGASDVPNVVVTLTDKVAMISGTVRSGDARTELEGTVVLLPVDTQGWMKTGMSPLRTASAPIAATGTYQLRVPLPGDYLLVVVPPDLDPEITPEFIKRFVGSGTRISIAAGETKTQDLTLPRAK